MINVTRIIKSVLYKALSFSTHLEIKEIRTCLRESAKYVIMHYCRIIFYFNLLFGFPTANFGPLSRGQPKPSEVNHCVMFIFDSKVTGSLVTRLGP